MSNYYFNDTIYEFFDSDELLSMDTPELITYLKENQNKHITHDDLTTSIFYRLSQKLEEAGETSLAMWLLESYGNAIIDTIFDFDNDGYNIGHYIDFNVDSLYAYGAHFNKNKRNSPDIMPYEASQAFKLCVNAIGITYDTIDEYLEKYPQLIEYFAEADDEDSIFGWELGLAYLKGTKSIQKDVKKAFEFFSSGADYCLDEENDDFVNTYVNCTLMTAAFYLKGIVVEKSFETALSYFMQILPNEEHDGLIESEEAYSFLMSLNEEGYDEEELYDEEILLDIVSEEDLEKLLLLCATGKCLEVIKEIL